MDALASALERSPELFPHSCDVRNDTVTLVRLSRADYTRASFLDARALGPHTLARTLPWGQLAAAAEAGKLSERCHFIFHIGHVGSTLLSRLLGAHAGLFALREPLVLRTFAQMRAEPELSPRLWTADEFDARLATMLKLWSRTFDPGQTAVVKATSFVSELAVELLGRPSEPKAILMLAKPEAYLATILGGPNSRQEAKMLAASRLKRLHRRLGRDVWRLAGLSEGEAIAMAWASETAALAAARASADARTMTLDFDAFLAAPQERLLAAFRFLDCEAAPDQAARILASPLMRTYSKAPEYAYSPQLRGEVLAEARAVDGGEIAKGLVWLARASETFPVVRECLALAG